MSDPFSSPEEIFRELLRPQNRLEAPRRIELCQTALRGVSRGENAPLWAGLHFELGNSFMRNPRGDRATNIERAIISYETAMQVFTRQLFPEPWAAIQHNLADAYRTRIRGTRADSVERAIACHKSALEIYTEQAFPLMWAKIQVGMANAYLDRICGDRANNIEQAIASCQAALKLLTREASPEDWAKAQVNLGIAYVERVHGERSENIEQAIVCYGAALVVYSRSEAWATVQVNMAIAYKARIRGDREENIEQAIACSLAALEIYRRDTFPDEWAKLGQSLGNTYRDRPRGNRAENIERAIDYYKVVLEVRTREAFPEDWAGLHIDLARAYASQICGDHARNVEEALGHYLAAHEVFIRESFHQNWAALQHGLGLAYLDRPSGDKAENIDKAISYFQSALPFFTRDALPHDWARLQHSLANAYRVRVLGDHAENLKNALIHYLRALRKYESLQLWGDQRDVGLNLGSAASTAGRWSWAYRGYSSALAAIEKFRTEVLTEETDQSLIAANDHVFWGAILAAQKTGQSAIALEHVEAAKSRLFLKQLGATGFKSQTDLPPGSREEEAGLSGRHWELSLYLKHFRDAARMNALHELEKIQRELSAFYDRLEAQEPDYVALRRGRPPTFTDISRFMSQQVTGTVLLAFYDMPDHVMVFALRPGDIAPVAVTVPLNQQRITEIGFSALEHMGKRPRSEKESFPPPWLQLSQALLLPELGRLLDDAKRVLLIPSGLLYRLPLHALIWREKPLIEHCQVTYAPSIAVAIRAQSRIRDGRKPMAACGYVDDVRLKSIFEGEAELVASIFETQALVGQQATIQAVTQEAREARILHLSSHGYFDPRDAMRSGLLLADGVLTASAVLTWRLPGSLVNLSACLTGLSQLSRGDELYGLMRAFFQAGASSLVLSLWEVDAETTLNLMSLFYGGLKESSNPAEAFQRAILATRKSRPHPYYWAPFIFVGDDRIDSGRRFLH